MEDYKIIELIEQKSYSELTEKERIFIEKSIGKESYNKQYALLINTKKSFKQEVNKVPLNTTLLASLKNDQQQKRRFLLPIWLRFPVPSYSLALLGLLFFVLFLNINPKIEKEIVYQNSDPITIFDTIIKVDTIVKYKEQIIKKNNAQLKQQPKQPNIALKNKFNNNLLADTNTFYFDKKDIINQQNKLGTSTADKEEFIKFLGMRV